MDQRPGQNVDLGLYFHREGPVSPKIRLKNQKMTEKNPKISKKIFESSTEHSLNQSKGLLTSKDHSCSHPYLSQAGGSPSESTL